MQDHDDSGSGDPIVTANRVRAARRTRAASAAVGIALLSGLGCCAYKFASQRSPQAMQGVFLLGFLGVALLLMEPASRFHRANWLRILLFYKSLRFYGIVISISAGFVLIFAFLISPVVQVNARSPVQIVERATPAAAPVVEAEPPKPPEFPPLEVAGVILGGSRSSALINGRTVLVGEFINDVKLAEVREDGVVVELQGVKKVIQRNAPHVPDQPPAVPKRR